jgi:hypothetical protein
MASVKDLQDLVDRVKSGTMPTDEVRGLLRHQSPLVRANALEGLVGPGRHDERLLDELIAAASASGNNGEQCPSDGYYLGRPCGGGLLTTSRHF